MGPTFCGQEEMTMLTKIYDSCEAMQLANISLRADKEPQLTI